MKPEPLKGKRYKPYDMEGNHRCSTTKNKKGEVFLDKDVKSAVEFFKDKQSGLSIKLGKEINEQNWFSKIKKYADNIHNLLDEAFEDIK